MNSMNCERVLDRLPDLATGRLDGSEAHGLRAHLEACDECREAWSVVSLLAESGPARVPAGLEARLQAAVGRDRSAGRGAASTPLRPRRRVPAWGLAAAAGIVLAVATPVLVDRMDTPPTATLSHDVDVAEALTASLPSPWLDDDEAFVAGAPVLDDLSDEALRQLLEEMGG